MNKRKAMIEALAMLSSEAEAMSQNALGMDAVKERKVQQVLVRLSKELQNRCFRMHAKENPQ